MEYVLRAVRLGFICLVVFKESLQLKDVRIDVPPAVVRGQDAILKCFFDLEGDRLYSVKWYRRGLEFYRYTPNENPPIKQFPIKGLHVNAKDSKDTQVVLEHVQHNVSGLFSCEVTADQPSFFTDMQTSSLQVVDLPKKDPYITGLKSRYRVNDLLRANCTCEHSNPAANLTWYVNGLAVDHHFVHRHRPRHSSDNYVTAHSILHFTITEKHFENRRLKIRCSATIHGLYHRSSEKSVELVKKKHRPPYTYYEIYGSTTPVTYQHWELAQAAERPPETTLVFHSPINSFASTSRAANIGSKVHQQNTVLLVVVEIYFSIVFINCIFSTR